jgi:hypothetical protein
VVTGQGLAAGPDGVQGVTLGAVAAAGPLGPVDLHHPLALVDQEPGQPRPIAARPLQRPDPPAGGLLVGQPEQPGMAGPVARHLQGGPHAPVGVQQGRGVAAAVGADPDDRVNLASSRGMAVAPSRRRPLAGTGLGWRHHAAAGL